MANAGYHSNKMVPTERYINRGHVGLVGGPRANPGTMTPGRVTPNMTPGRVTPVALTSKKYYDIMAASSASTVAIDNKIEQAMDLVKSHLMFAVREEVEVLKEKIGELMERITQLEYENNVLRQYATQEALQQLQNQQKQNHCNT